MEHTAEERTANVAVVIVNWNSGKLLQKCLDALANQTVHPQRTIVVDNASSDGSVDEIESRYKDVEVIRLDQNSGFAAGNNVGVQTASGCEWVALLNPDAFPEVDWLKNLLDAAESHPEFSFFSSRLINADNQNLLDGVGDIYHVSGLVWRKGHGAPVSEYGRESKDVFSPCAAAVMYKTKEFLEVEGFDENYFCYSEDIDLAFRLRLMGGRCLHVDDAVVAHVGSATTVRHSDFQIYHGHRNLVWTFVKNMPWPLFWLYLPQHLILNLVTVIGFSFRGRGRVILKAKWDAIKKLHIVLRQRQAVQKKRKVDAVTLWRIMTKGMLKPYLRKR